MLAQQSRKWEDEWPHPSKMLRAIERKQRNKELGFVGAGFKPAHLSLPT